MCKFTDNPVKSQRENVIRAEHKNMFGTWCTIMSLHSCKVIISSDKASEKQEHSDHLQMAENK